MKRPFPHAILLLFTVMSLATYAQNALIAKPAQFASLPDRISCSPSDLNSAFSVVSDQPVRFSFSNDFTFTGTVISNVYKYSNLQTVIIKSSLFGDAIFSLSKITNKDNSINYVGRIINKKYFDGYQLKKDASNNYQFVKIETDKVIQDCSHN
jgi:hypothetical protein